MFQPVILCGGTGSRLWPLSRTQVPKPFIRLLNDQPTLFQQTAQRLQGAFFQPPLVVCAEDHRFLVLQQLAEIGLTPAAVILEPTPRSTAPAVALAVHWALQTGQQAPLVLAPADHLMGPPAEFQNALTQIHAAAKHHLITFGIAPTFPNPEYGYIQAAPVPLPSPHQLLFQVVSFHEKPTRELAQQMLAAGNHSWNSGIFVGHPILLMQEFQSHSPLIWQTSQQAWQQSTTEQLQHQPGQTAILHRPGGSFAQVPAEAFDTAIMEKTKFATVLPYAARWSDIGSFAALHQAMPQNEQGNTIQTGPHGHAVTINTSGSFIHGSTPHKVIATLGLNNAIVIDTPDALLVTTHAHTANVKQVFAELQNRQLPQASFPPRVQRPWGWYETVAQGQGFLVKRIGVVPGGRLSLQYHHHRAEHWVVVQGTATVTRGQEVFTLQPDQSTYIPLGAPHRLENLTSQPLEIVEVQTGSKLEEADIVRLDDVYQRT